jgi:molybdopterin-containing oxidoreductase family molybdopterin binding subunit
VGGVKNANGYILQNQKVLDPLFESKSDFYIERGIAEAMGLGDLMPQNGEEYARAILTSDDPQIAGFTLEKLTEANGALKLLGSEDELGPEIGFEYHTPTGKQEPYYENMLKWGQAFPMWEEPNETYADNPLREKYPLQFGQARTRFRVHSAYSGAGWIQDLYEPHIELNPADAEARGLADGDQVEAFNDRGSFTTKLRVNEAIRPGSAFMAESTYRQYMDGTMMQNVTNDQLSERGYDLLFGPMIPYNDTLIEIKKVGA